ncbi:MAG: BrnA antitoxin family protein, partial [Candidatus Methylomirabilis sp.]|nr:BrnA antitoxin family protein [Deltaproteobacteria bacterium]
MAKDKGEGRPEREARRKEREARQDVRKEARGRRGRPKADPEERKDKILHARIPEKLEAQLKQEARKMRIPVSNLVRNILEDTFHFVDDIVADSFEIVDTVRRDAIHIAQTAARTYGSLSPKRQERPGEAEEAAPEEPESGLETPAAAPEGAEEAEAAADPFADIYGWQELRLSRDTECAACGGALQKGATAFLGQSEDPRAPRRWLCAPCME